jgi:hypothetical protein
MQGANALEKLFLKEKRGHVKMKISIILLKTIDIFYDDFPWKHHPLP